MARDMNLARCAVVFVLALGCKTTTEQAQSGGLRLNKTSQSSDGGQPAIAQSSGGLGLRVETSSDHDLAIIKCRVLEDGTVRNCNVMKNTSTVQNVTLIQKLEATRAKPTMRDGGAVETDYVFNLKFEKKH